MRRRGLQDSVNFAVASLLFALLAVWGLFAVLFFRGMAREAEKSAEQMARHIVGVMEGELLTLEHASFELSQSEVARDFVTTGDTLEFHSKAAQVSPYISGLVRDSQYVDCLILYGSEQQYYRFAGSVSNTSAAKAYYAARPGATPAYMAIPLDGHQYIGYATGIFSGGEMVGKAVLLMEEGRVRALFNRYADTLQLDLALAADGQLLVASGSGPDGLTLAALEARNTGSIRRQVGYTPFELVVGWRSGYLSSGVLAFAVSALVTAAICALLLILYTRFLRRHFFAPMFHIIQGVEQLGEGQAMLPRYGEEAFDGLADKINQMVKRLNERSAALFQTRFRVQELEIQRQNEVIASLKKQISAHFTVNTLSVIRLLQQRGQTEQAGVVCDGLSRMLRYVNAADDCIDGMSEFETLGDYAAIMQARYPGRFTVAFDADDRLGDVEMPRMLVQPVLENAILHGFQSISRGGRIEVSGRVQADAVEISVADNGAGMTADALEALRSRLRQAAREEAGLPGLDSIALCNIARRLRSYYGPAGRLTVDAQPGGGTVVRLRFSRKIR